MARFMIANLQMGTIDGKRILSGKARAEMQATQFRNHPKFRAGLTAFRKRSKMVCASSNTAAAMATAIRL
jgi:hypothetical protein